ncbi:alpha/beta fold hydrolase [Dokdonia donghaensis]|uniref:Alpha/beta hydrolase n=1 Tax=Dokdonia donghaensis DSW-1 TaxID=1300343 RepID=A0A0A2H287_9FLAO|nr:alpha/beta hydrolase [Dokdonia donghaensis]ANH59359.1 4,5:9,10-diseco-3-hydroxy-5,9,17-trioxoandrosta-1(10),2-diene-4-oate hydrolase [Dokdonia donghaensis DSW-1]KGO06755.1 alpha/beta hydrolase [Dokdonia donghaensis DSW-1]
MQHIVIKYLFVIWVILSFTSCTTLQWRASDKEILKTFSSEQIPTKISYFKIDSLNLKIRFQTVEVGDNDINLVFLHGSPSSLSAWSRYLNDSTLYNNANLHAIDRPGYGYSNFGDAITSIEQQATIINNLLQYHNIDNVIAIGSSYGGPLAARLAITNPAIKGVIMISPAIDPDNEQRIWQSDFTQFWLTRWLVPTGYRVAGDEKTVHAAELLRIAGDWSKLTIPVIHIHGDKDDLVPYENINYTKRVFLNSEVITIPDTGHEIAWARPELIKPYIFRMIEKVKDKKLD